MSSGCNKPPAKVITSTVQMADDVKAGWIIGPQGVTVRSLAKKYRVRVQVNESKRCYSIYGSTLTNVNAALHAVEFLIKRKRQEFQIGTSSIKFVVLRGSQCRWRLVEEDELVRPREIQPENRRDLYRVVVTDKNVISESSATAKMEVTDMIAGILVDDERLEFNEKSWLQEADAAFLSEATRRINSSTEYGSLETRFHFGRVYFKRNSRVCQPYGYMAFKDFHDIGRKLHQRSRWVSSSPRVNNQLPARLQRIENELLAKYNVDSVMKVPFEYRLVVYLNKDGEKLANSVVYRWIDGSWCFKKSNGPKRGIYYTLFNPDDVAVRFRAASMQNVTPERTAAMQAAISIPTSPTKGEYADPFDTKVTCDSNTGFTVSLVDVRAKACVDLGGVHYKLEYTSKDMNEIVIGGRLKDSGRPGDQFARLFTRLTAP